MPITIQPATLKVKKQNGQYQSADCLKGDKGDPGSVGIIAPNYADLTFPVAQGQPCIHEGLYYIANSAIQSSEDWTAAHWTQLTVGEQVTDVLTAIQGLDNDKYEKPSGGIPATDMTQAVQDALADAESAYQKPSGGIPASDIADGVIPVVDNALSNSSENAVQNKVVKGALDTKAPVIINTATGNPAVFNDGGGMPIKSLLIQFTPRQTGSGDPSPSNIRPIVPWNGLTVFGGGKNILNPAYFAESSEFYSVDGGTITAKKSDWRSWADLPKLFLKAGKYTITKSTDEGLLVVRSSINNYSSSILYAENVAYGSFTLSSDAYIAIKPSENMVYPATFTLQIEVGTESTAYEPYHPITETDIVFPSPVYGGTLDVVSGVLTVEWAEIVFKGTEEWVSAESDTFFVTPVSALKNNTAKQSIICDLFKYSLNDSRHLNNGEFTDSITSTYNIRLKKPNSEMTVQEFKSLLASNNMHIVYKLETPQEIQLTPQQITALVGDNTIWSDTDGQMTVEYPADTETFIANQHRNFIAPELSSMIADTALVKNDFRIVGNDLYKITTAIASGGTLTPNTNCVKTTLAEVIKPLLT